MQGYKIVLGSSSKWRREVLERLGYQFSCMSPDIDEKAIRHPDPKEMTLMIARAKGQALLSKVLTSFRKKHNSIAKFVEDKQISEPTLLITSDQVVSWNGQVREKPESAQQC